MKHTHTPQAKFFAVLAAFTMSFGVVSPAFAAATAPMQPYSGAAIAWPDISATSAIVYDPITNVSIYEKNADAPRALASLSKLMTAAVVDDLITTNPTLAKKYIVIQNTSNQDPADFQLKNGSRWLATDLLKYMLIGSSNKAADNLASQLIPLSSFMSLMNFKARQWGLADTVFYTPSGLSVQNKSVVSGKTVVTETEGSISTARQAALLLWNVYHDHESLLDITQDDEGLFKSEVDSITVKNTDLLTKASSSLPIVAGKTGYTDIAGGNLAVILQPDTNTDPHVIVVLGSTVDDRFSDVEGLASSSPYILSSK